VACGSNETCNTAQTFCCLNQQDCYPLNAQCSGPDLYCDGPEDCTGTGQVCCSTQVQPGNFNLKCEQKSTCTGSEKRVICGNDPSVCDPGQQCINHPTGTKYCATQ
jgi:hypothetical protein